MRALIFELRPDAVEGGLVAALSRHSSMLSARHGLDIEVEGPERLALSLRGQTELFAIGREALCNVVKHAGVSKAWFTSRLARAAFSSRLATTDPVSTPLPDAPATSASSRCGAARPSSAGC